MATSSPPTRWGGGFDWLCDCIGFTHEAPASGQRGLVPNVPAEVTTMAKVQLRRNAGSFDEVTRVYAYQPDVGRALVRLKGFHGEYHLAEVEVTDLEALEEIDGQRWFRDVDEHLRKRAGEVLEPQHV